VASIWPDDLRWESKDIVLYKQYCHKVDIHFSSEQNAPITRKVGASMDKFSWILLCCLLCALLSWPRAC